MTKQQKYRLKYSAKVLTFFPLLITCIIGIPFYWIASGKNSVTWLVEQFMEYKEPKKVEIISTDKEEKDKYEF